MLKPTMTTLQRTFTSECNNAMFSSQIARFVPSNFIQDLCQEEYEPAVVAATDPDTFFVRSNWVFQSPEDQTVRRAFQRVFRKDEQGLEMRTYASRLRFGEYSETDVYYKLCKDSRSYAPPVCSSLEPESNTASPFPISGSLS